MVATRYYSNNSVLAHTQCHCQDCKIRIFFGAIGRNDEFTVEHILNNNPQFLNIPMVSFEHSTNETALFKAIRSFRPKIVKLLINKKHLDLHANSNGIPPLLFAWGFLMRKGQRYSRNEEALSIITSLIWSCDLTVTVNNSAKNNYNLYHEMSCGHHNQDYEYLFNVLRIRELGGAIMPDINQIDNNGQTPLGLALYNKVPDMLIEKLIKSGANYWFDTPEFLELKNSEEENNGWERIQKRRTREGRFYSSLYRLHGKSGNNDIRLIKWKSMPDEVWREILEYV